MKKTLFSLTSALLLAGSAFAQSPSAWVNCGSGSTMTHTWVGGGSDSSWFTASNWSTNAVPDCNDNVVFSGTTDPCIVDGDVKVRDITLNNGWKGRLLVQNVTIEARDVTVIGSMLTRNVGFPRGGVLKANNLTIGNNGYAGLWKAEIFSALNLQAAGYLAMYFNGYLNVGTFTMGDFSQFVAPDGHLLNPDVKVVVRGNFSRNARSSFRHARGLFEFSATSSIDLNLSSGAGQTGARTNMYNVVINMTGSSDNVQISSSDTLAVENRLTIIEGEFRSGGGANAWVVIEDTLEYNGIGDGGSQASFLFRGPKTCDLFLSEQDVTGGSSTMYFTNNTVIWKGAASTINSRFTWNLQGDANVSFGDDVDVNQKRALTVGSSATLNLPDANTFSLENANLTVAGTIEPGMGTFAFTGNSDADYDLQGGTKNFYNVIINKGTAGTTNPGNLEPVTGNGADVMRVKGDLTFDEADWRNGNTGSVIEVEGDWIVTANNTNNAGTNNGMSVRFVGTENSNLQSDGRLIGDCDIQINKDDATDKVTVTGSLQDIGNEASIISINKGKLVFDGTKDATLRGSDQPGLVVSSEGQLVAPDDDVLTISASWDFDGSNSFDCQNGTVRMSVSGDRDNFDQNNSSVTFNNINFASNSRWHFGNNAGANSDELYVKGDFNISNTGARVRYVTVQVEGDFTTIAGTGTKSELQEVIFTGSADQILNCGDADEIREGIEINKSGGKVTLADDLSLNALTLTAGNLVTGTYQLIVTGNSAISGGSSSSFVDGKLTRVASGGNWSGGITFPIGKGSAYRPVVLTNSGSSNTWNAEYFAADPAAAFGSTVNAPLDAISGGEYWTIARTAGSQPTTIGLSTAGSSFADADTRVARWNTGTSSWDDFGPGAGASGGSVVSSSTVTSTGTYNFTLGVDNPAPNRVSTGIEVSGNELTTEKSNLPAVSAAAANAVTFSVFPNPVSETLFFALNGADKGNVVLSDMSGKVLGVFNVAETRSISMQNLSAGVYFATFTNGVQRITHRVVRN
jgi:hypothetical protein